MHRRSTQFTLLTLAILSIHGSLLGQTPEKANAPARWSAGAELQWYPAGWILGPSIQYNLSGRHYIHGRVGVNLIDRRDWSGLNDDETGTGWGFSGGYRYKFRPEGNAFFLGARVELWFANIDWEDEAGTPQAASGTTSITILQPSIEAGYWLQSSSGKWNFLFSAGVGREINIRTEGKEVGQGGMWLLGFSVYRRL